MSCQQMEDIVLCAVGGQFLAWEKKSWTLLSKTEVFERLSSWLGKIGDGLGRFSFSLWQSPGISIVLYFDPLACSTSYLLASQHSTELREEKHKSQRQPE